MRRITIVPLAASLSLLLLTGCAHLLGTADSPRVNIAAIQPKDVKLFEQVFEMELRIMNPGGKELAVKGLVFDLEVNGQPFARGVSNQEFTIGPFSTYILRVEAVTTLANLLRQIAQAQKDELPGFTYRLKGHFHSDAFPFRVSFDETGGFKRSSETAR